MVPRHSPATAFRPPAGDPPIWPGGDAGLGGAACAAGELKMRKLREEYDASYQPGQRKSEVFSMSAVYPTEIDPTRDDFMVADDWFGFSLSPTHPTGFY